MGDMTNAHVNCQGRRWRRRGNQARKADLKCSQVWFAACSTEFGQCLKNNPIPFRIYHISAQGSSHSSLLSSWDTQGNGVHITIVYFEGSVHFQSLFYYVQTLWLFVERCLSSSFSRVLVLAICYLFASFSFFLSLSESLGALLFLPSSFASFLPPLSFSSSVLVISSNLTSLPSRLPG